MNPLVTVEWLNERLNSPDNPDSKGAPTLAILDATLPPVGVTPAPDVRGRYLAGHIPGSVYFDIEEFSDHATSLPHMLPSPEEFARKISALGVSDSMAIVVYEQTGVFSAPRAWWMLRTFGAQKVYLLDGGLKAWMDAGLPLQTGEVALTPATFNAKFQAEAVRSFDQMQGILAEHGQILDARSAGRFAGTAPEPRPGLSSGHMPGATSVPFTELVEDGRLKDADQLGELFQAKGIDLNEPITTTCGSGVTAAVIALGLEIVGAQSVSLYDGSWAEYAQHPESVIEKGS
jgi:thiosulfate/3-mercaptopyruvate sulfurtransferase